MSDSDLTFTISDTAGDDTTVVYVFTIGTNHEQAVAYSPFAINGFGTGGGSVSITSIIYYGPYKTGVNIHWGEYLKNMLIADHAMVFVYDSSNNTASLDDNPFISDSLISEFNRYSLEASIIGRNTSITYSPTGSFNVLFKYDDYTQQYLLISLRCDTPFRNYTILSDVNYSITLNSYINTTIRSIDNNGSQTLTVNDFIATNSSPKISGPVVYNRAVEAIGNEPIPHVSSLQMVQTNLQTIYDRLGGAMVEAEGYGITRQYFAAGDFADRIWERFNELINEGTVGTNTAAIADQLDTIFRTYTIAIPTYTDAKAITATLNYKDYSLYIEHEGAYYAVMSSQDGITVNGVSGGATWETLTGGDIVINNGKLFYNNVSQPIITDWTTDELGNVNASIDTKTAVLVDGKKYPLITFKNISPSLIWINESDGQQ